jgi:uncharacterized protein (UPF0333 family)
MKTMSEGGHASLEYNHSLMATVAHYNLAVEYEFLNEFTEALLSINTAYEIAKNKIGLEHNLTKKIEEVKRKLI